MTRLAGQRAVVIGGTSGIGAAVASALSAEGAEVLRASRTTGLDLSDSVAVEDWFARQGSIDHLVVTAGSQAPGGPLSELDLNAAKAAFDIKFWGSVRAAQVAAKWLRPGGTITLTTGFLSRRTTAGTFTKTAINAALEATAKLLAKELAPIRVNVVSPGLTDTEAYAAMTDDGRTAMYASAAARLPAGRVARPEDVAAGYIFALTNPSVTGAVIDIDGGALIA